LIPSERQHKYTQLVNATHLQTLAALREFWSK